MKKYVNVAITVSAVIGIIIFLGAAGTSDYMIEAGLQYPFIKTIKTLLVSIIMSAPALIREVIEWLEIH